MKHFSTHAIAILSMLSSVFLPTRNQNPSRRNGGLHDGRLVVPELNFSINSPTADAKWSYSGDLPKVDGKSAPS